MIFLKEKTPANVRGIRWGQIGAQRGHCTSNLPRRAPEENYAQAKAPNQAVRPSRWLLDPAPAPVAEAPYLYLHIPAPQTRIVALTRA